MKNYNFKDMTYQEMIFLFSNSYGPLRRAIRKSFNSKLKNDSSIVYVAYKHYTENYWGEKPEILFHKKFLTKVQNIENLLEL